MKGERKAKGKRKFSTLALPSRILIYSKLVKGERKAKGKRKFSTFGFAEPHPIYLKIARMEFIRSYLKLSEVNGQ